LPCQNNIGDVGASSHEKSAIFDAPHGLADPELAQL
jgi:hypothetical protein